jgi:S-adenosylmethionine:tRNA ribosyltransferase-isomerase
MYTIDDYDYDLPEELIAQVPAPNRSSSRLLLVERHKKVFSDHHFFDLPTLLKPGDLLVVNNTRVVPAKLFGTKESGGKIELLVLGFPDDRVSKPTTCWCLLRSSKRPKEGSYLFFDSDVSGLVESYGRDGLIQITFQGTPSIDCLLEEKGCMPVPPYIKRTRENGRSPLDRERYQTVFSSKKGAVAAPTAGLHFTEELIKALHDSGISIAELTLHVGHGTFRPVRTKDIRNHKIGEESFSIEPDTAQAITGAKKDGRRVVAVGTTVVRALETVAGQNGEITPQKGSTELFITPGFRFKAVDGVITNFHLPKSSLLLLVSAFGGLRLIKEAYYWAISKQYRFYSYGDAMMII